MPEVKLMNGQSLYVGRIDGINIIPSEDIPPGFKRTVGSDIFVNEHNYDLLKTVSAKAMLMFVGGGLKELASTD